MEAKIPETKANTDSEVLSLMEVIGRQQQNKLQDKIEKVKEKVNRVKEMPFTENKEKAVLELEKLVVLLSKFKEKQKLLTQEQLETLKLANEINALDEFLQSILDDTSTEKKG